MIIDEEEHLAHYGILRRSGRYPWGSGGTENKRNRMFLDTIDDLKNQGMNDQDICKAFGIGTTDSAGVFHPSTTQLRAAKTIARTQQQLSKISQAERLKEKGYSNGAIAERMGLAGESSVRALLAPGARRKAEVLTQTADMLKRHVDEKQFVDVGSGTENYLHVSKEKLNAAVAILREKGYEVHTVPTPQLGTGKDTKVKVLAPPGTTWGDVRRNQDKIQSIEDFTTDGGLTWNKAKPPLPVSLKRVGINYKEDGGDKADGVIYVRPGIKDISIGDNRYAQVRIQVGEGHYLKGMAMYKDDLPDGVDLLFNTNKSNTGNKLDALKPLERDASGNIDKDLPFGSVVRQILDKPGHPDAKVTSAMNIVGGKEGAGEEGGWATWSNTLSSQFLSKQSPSLAKTQLDVTYDRRKNEFDEIMALTNPTIKKRLLEEFANECDSAAVHLKAAHLPRQSTHVILPINSMKDGEVYAPGFRNGERVVLIRFPHGGTFEIPELVVNNKHREAKSLLGNAVDAIGINHKVAQHLSGADFDGDTVLVIPNNQRRIKISPALEGLKNFDPQMYKLPDDSPIPRMTSREKGIEMGKVSNLITDMTIRQASHDQIARAVKHSMVVIDAEKHNLNYRQSALDNGIAQLKAEYQGGSTKGASTLISQKKQTERVPELRPRRMSEGGPVDPVTGRRVFVETGRTRIARDGEVVPRTTRVKKLDRTDDAHTMSSGTVVERLYADHSNRLKALANQARLASINTPRLVYSPSANKTYARQVESLTSKLALAERNAPRERQAQITARAVVRAKLQDNPNLESETVTKIRNQALEEARTRMGARKPRIDIDQDEWDAIQAGAISDHRLNEILRHANIDVVRSFATPRREHLMTNNMTLRAQQMLAAGFTRAEVADQLGVSLTTLDAATTETSSATSE